MRGVYYDALRRKPFRATIQVEGKTKHLGSYNTEAEAVAAFEVALAKRTEDIIKSGKLHVNSRKQQRLLKSIPTDADKYAPTYTRLPRNPTASLSGTPWFGL